MLVELGVGVGLGCDCVSSRRERETDRERRSQRSRSGAKVEKSPLTVEDGLQHGVERLLRRGGLHRRQVLQQAQALDLVELLTVGWAVGW